MGTSQQGKDPDVVDSRLTEKIDARGMPYMLVLGLACCHPYPQILHENCFAGTEQGKRLYHCCPQNTCFCVASHASITQRRHGKLQFSAISRWNLRSVDEPPPCLAAQVSWKNQINILTYGKDGIRNLTLGRPDCIEISFEGLKL
ncbi:hypothetical protein SLA2020_262530 [Shorea laevis]